jgi:cell division protein FtsW
MTAAPRIQLRQNHREPPSPATVDLTILVPTLVLVGLGVAMVFSASIPMAAVDESEDIYKYLTRELGFAAVGLALMYGISRLRMDLLRRYARVVFAAAIVLLIAVLVVGLRINGARSWLPIPGTPFRFQPSEMAKIALVLATARFFARYPMGLPSWRRALPPFGMLAATLLLIAVEPDMGTAAVLGAAMLVFFHIAGAQLRHVLAAAIVAGGGAAAMIACHPYQMERVVSFFGPDREPLDAGYQATQSLIALGSGGLSGRGYCGSVWKYFYLPAAITDSILAVIGEELGLIATWAVLAAFAFLVWRGLVVAGRAPDRFSGLVAAGVTWLLCIQALVNVAVATDAIPATGVPLPFVSYGGSSLLFSLIGVGLLLNVARRQVLPAAARGRP